MPGLGRFWLPPPTAITHRVGDNEAGVGGELPLSMLGLGEGSSHLAEIELRLERLDLLEQPIGQLLTGADRKAGDVVDGLLGIKLGALAAGPVENIDNMRLQPREAELENSKEPDRPSSNNNNIGGSATCRHRLLVPA
jgi:hypothetical protein